MIKLKTQMLLLFQLEEVDFISMKFFIFKNYLILGGLIAGVAVAAKSIKSNIQIIVSKNNV